MKIKPEYTKEAELIFNKFGGGKLIVGVHIRGTDMKTAPNHPISPSVEQYILKLQELIDNKGIGKIFLCTDEVQTVNVIKEKFGDMVLCTDSFRSSDGKSIHVGHGDESRHNNRFLMGKEVLIDTILLSKCDYLCCGHSNVSYAAIVMNQNRYKDIFLIENENQDFKWTN